MKAQFASKPRAAESPLAKFGEKVKLDCRQQHLGIPEAESSLKNWAWIELRLHIFANHAKRGRGCQVPNPRIIRASGFVAITQLNPFGLTLATSRMILYATLARCWL